MGIKSSYRQGPQRRLVPARLLGTRCEEIMRDVYVDFGALSCTSSRAGRTMCTCWSTTRPRSLCSGWRARSRASPRAACVRNCPTTFAAAYGATISGDRLAVLAAVRGERGVQRGGVVAVDGDPSLDDLVLGEAHQRGQFGDARFAVQSAGQFPPGPWKAPRATPGVCMTRARPTRCTRKRRLISPTMYESCQGGELDLAESSNRSIALIGPIIPTWGCPADRRPR